MLPFLSRRPQQDAGLIIQDRNPDSDAKDDLDGGGLEEAMRPLMDAIHARDTKAMAQAFKDAFDLAEMTPHEEQPDDDDQGDMHE